MYPQYTNHHLPHEYIPFPKLGSGSQFHAYDLYDGRVLKIPLTKEETHAIIAKRRHNMKPAAPETTAPSDARIHTIINGKGRIPQMINHAFKDSSSFLKLMGNPELIATDDVLPEDTPTKEWGVGRVVYTQDKVLMVADMLRNLQSGVLEDDDVRKLKKIIELYIEKTYQMWSFGYSDYVFKIGDTGLDKNGNLVLVDIGEYSHDPQFIMRAISDQRWLHSIMSEKIDFPQIPRQLHQFFTETCNHAFTPEKLKQYWRTNHICSECTVSSEDPIKAFIAAKASEIDLVDRW